MIRPTGRALAIAGGLLPLAALPTITGSAGAVWLWVAAWGGLLAALLVEFALLPTPRSIAATVKAPPSLPLGERDAVTVELTSTRRTTLALLLDVGGPQTPWPAATTALAPEVPTRVAFELAGERRGTVRIEALHRRWCGPLGMLQATACTPLDQRVAVVPNVPKVQRQALRMLARREFRAGVRIERYLGDGSEFEALREFVVGMDRRAIDWKATARHRQVLCREFRAERDHQVLLCVDTGRLMGEPLAGMPRLDHAIHAALQLGYVCLRTGDRVGMHAFAAAPQHYLAPQAGMPALQAVQHRMADLAYTTEETNFTRGLTDLLQRLQRRSLVVLFTDFVDTITADLMLRNVQWLARRHVLVFVAMRDPLLPDLAGRKPKNLGDVQRAVIADELRRERDVVLERLRSHGAQVIDCGVEELAVALVDRYLAVKRRELV